MSYSVRSVPGGATSWSARLASANRFLTRSFETTQSIRAGLRRPDDTDEMVTVVDQGPVRSYRMTATPDSATLVLSGYDRSHLMITQRIRRLYRRSRHLATSTGSSTPGVPIGDLPIRDLPSLTGNLVLPDIDRPGILSQAVPSSGEMPVSEGIWTTRTIAEDICQRKGIPLAWQAPEHTLIEDFTASGRVSEVIQQLLSVWREVPGPKQIDIFFGPISTASGSASGLIVRQRGQGAPVVWETSPGDLGLIAPLELEARPTFPDGTPGIVIVRGRPGGGVTFIPGESVEEIVADTADVTITAVYREPDHSLLSMTTVYKFPAGVSVGPDGQPVIMREVKTREWEAAVYDGGRSVNQPRLIASEDAQFGLHPKASGSVQLTRSRVDVWYDVHGFLTSERTYTQAWQPESGTTAAGLKDTGLSLRTCVDGGPEVWVDTHFSYRAGASARLLVPASGPVRNWPMAPDIVQTSRQSHAQSGYRPFGPGRRNTGGGGGGSTPLTVVKTIVGGDPDYAIEVQDGNIDEATAQAIAQAFVTSATTPHEIEISFTGVSVPWLRRGSMIRLTGIVTEDASPIVLPAALITEIEFTGEPDSALMSGRAVCWTAEP